MQIQSRLDLRISQRSKKWQIDALSLAEKQKETDISVGLNIDGTGKSNIDTGIGFFNHMLEGFSKHGFFDLDMTCDGDLNVDCHHTIETAA